MTPLVVLSVALIVGGLSATTYFTLSGGGGVFGRWLRTYEARLELHTAFLLAEFHGRDVARAQVLAVCMCLTLLLATQRSAFAALACLLALVPPFVLWKRHQARVAKLERQLDTWLLMLANALKATSSVGEAIASTAALVPRPFSEEVDLLVKELRLGVPLQQALCAAGRRIGSTIVSSALMMILVARQTGGNLSDTLERASAALREAARLEGVLRTKTAEGRGQVIVLSLVPFVLCILIAWLDRSWFDPLLHQSHGRAILAACALAWTTAAIWAHHIVGAEL